jgi:proteasome lid subunit RPN8/RPN11
MIKELRRKGSLDVYRCGYYNIIRSVVEAFPREETGYLIGKRKRGGFIISNAYPIISSRRMPHSVSVEDNIEARLMRLESAIQNGSESAHIGGYHSHPKRNMLNELSDGDLEYIRQQLEFLNRDFWVEIVVKIESRRKYKLERKICERYQSHQREPKKLKIEIWDEPFHAYHLTFSSFLVDRNMNVKELKLNRMERRRTV